MDLEKSASPDRRAVWKRGLLMLLFVLAVGIAIGLLNLLAFVQFLWLLFAGEPNQFLLRFGRSLSLWLAEAARFLSCANDEMPFPWKAWPDVE
jgi:hypothetical protein